jgi:hypothetical protein
MARGDEKKREERESERERERFDFVWIRYVHIDCFVPFSIAD